MAAATKLKFLTVPASAAKHTATVIFLHVRVSRDPEAIFAKLIDGAGFGRHRRVRFAHTDTRIDGSWMLGSGWEPVARMLAKNPGLGHVKWILPRKVF